MPRTTNPGTGAADRRVSRRGMLALAGLLLLAYLPSLGGTFLSDDERFIVANPAVHRLSAVDAVRYFTDPGTVASEGTFGIYRPLRTLDYAIDWSIAGDSPLFFRIRSLLYGILGAILVWSLFSRLLGEEKRTLAGAAFLGAALFALHPVQTESVAFVSSRGDLLCLCLFVGALIFHLDGRTRAAALLLLPALFAKEVAVVFPAAAWLADGFAGRPRVWRRYGIYAAISGGFVLLWFLLVARPHAGVVAQRPGWPGGSWLRNLVTVGKGFLLYARELLLPVDFVFDYYVPARAAVLLRDVLLAGTGFAVFAVPLFLGRRLRFAAMWFLVLILPVSGLVVPLTIPTTERWLLLPSLGLCLLAGWLLIRTRLRYAVLGLFLLLTASRAADWRSFDTLAGANSGRADTPLTLGYRAYEELKRSADSRDSGAALEVLETSDRFFALYRDDIAGPIPVRPAVRMLSYRANALIRLGRSEEALDSVREALRRDPGDWTLHDTAGVALRRLGRTGEAVTEAAAALERHDAPETRERLAGLLYRYGTEKEAHGDRGAAVELYRRSWSTLPDPRRNPGPPAALRRLGIR